MDKSTTAVVDVSSSLSEIDGTGTQKIIKDTEELNTTTNQLDLTDIYRTLHSRNNFLFKCTQRIHQDGPYPES